MLPEGAVRQKMAMEGFSQTEIDDFIAGKIPTVAAPAVAAVPAVDPRYEKFEKMKKMLPEGAVRQKMAMEGFTQTEIDDFIAGKVPTAAVAPAAAPVADPRFEKFEKMKKMLPEGAVRQKMAIEGFSQTEIDDFMAGKVPTVAGAAPAAAAVPSKFEKFEKMKKMLPEGAVRQKMAMEGITQGEIDDFFAGKISESSSSSPAAVGGAGADPKAALKAGLAGALALKGKGGPGGVKVEAKTPAAPPRVPKYSVKCKNIYWNKIPETDVKNTIWKDIKQFELNAQIKKEIEEWFAAKAAASAAAKDLATVTTVALAASKLHHSTKPKLVSLVDSKRTQNILIALGKIRRPPDEIAKIILELDPAVLTLEMTQSLLSILPTPEEFTTVKEYPNPDQLDKASIFVYELAKVPHIQQRLQTHEIIFTWFGQVNHIQTQLTAFQNACDELSKAQKDMETILAIILSIGNYVNDCTKFGDAVGIKLDTLMKLPTMKANNEQQYGNFLHFLALLLSKQYPEILKFSESFVSIWAAAELSFTQIVNDVAIVEKQVLKLTDDSQKIKDGKGEKLGATLIPLPPVPQPPSNGIAGNDNYYHNPLYRRIITFLNDAKPKLGNIKQQFKTVEHNLENIMNRFGESNKAMNEEDNAKQFFTIVTTFIKQLSKAHDDNVKKEQAKIRKAKIEKEKAEREKKRLERLSEKNGTAGGGTTGISRGNLTISQDEKTSEEGSSSKTPPRTPKGDGELELPDDNIFKDFFNRRSQSIEKTRNEFKNKLQRSVRFSTGFKVSTDEGDEDEGIMLSPKSPNGSANAASRKSAKQDFRKSATITELNEDEEEED